ncbi:hypothetical protein [Spirosoma foliorum]|uniref:ABC transporter permease n=1 Tax=Spirosoma foliorum TaxID=2710596 RepID=A0A7G5H2N1_9BACT|nr:hypothetical protein [Spirosoma foliorum]QMW05373.1 hypothetical protein H3H32_11010 [Spirosoma foliorum]
MMTPPTRYRYGSRHLFAEGWLCFREGLFTLWRIELPELLDALIANPVTREILAILVALSGFGLALGTLLLLIHLRP